jgi:hypothetical protein
MSWFQLDPSSIAQRARTSGATAAIPTLAASVWRGLIGFTLVSVAGFIPWAVFGRPIYQVIGEAGLYAVCALVFIGLSGPLLHRLIIGSGSLPRFYKLFSIAFTAYSVFWILGWMAFRGHPGSIAGLLAGTAIMGAILTIAFDARRSAFPIIAALFLLNSAGYFVGGWIEGWLMPLKQLSLLGFVVSRPTIILLAKLQWGVCYGLGFGAGLGLAFHLCQTAVREFLTAASQPTPPLP